MTPKPSIGRIVHYVSYGTPGGEYGKECRAAIITQVNEGDNVGLAVLNPLGVFLNPSNPADHSECPSGGTWHWPEVV